jgi:hypothetical protein
MSTCPSSCTSPITQTTISCYFPSRDTPSRHSSLIRAVSTHFSFSKHCLSMNRSSCRRQRNSWRRCCLRCSCAARQSWALLLICWNTPGIVRYWGTCCSRLAFWIARKSQSTVWWRRTGKVRRRSWQCLFSSPVSVSASNRIRNWFSRCLRRWPIRWATCWASRRSDTCSLIRFAPSGAHSHKRHRTTPNIYITLSFKPPWGNTTIMSFKSCNFCYTVFGVESSCTPNCAIWRRAVLTVIAQSSQKRRSFSYEPKYLPLDNMRESRCTMNSRE